MSEIHVKILQDAKRLLESASTSRFICLVVKESSNWDHFGGIETMSMKAAKEISKRIQIKLFPYTTFENWLYYNDKITTDEHLFSTTSREWYETSRVKTMRLSFVDELIEHYKK